MYDANIYMRKKKHVGNWAPKFNKPFPAIGNTFQPRKVTPTLFLMSAIQVELLYRREALFEQATEINSGEVTHYTGQTKQPIDHFQL